MPIPTRSASLREPRKVGSQGTYHSIPDTVANLLQPSSIARPASSGLKAPTRPTTATTSTSTSTDGSSSSTKEPNVSNRGRTLLPQRSNTGQDDVSGAQPRFPPGESRLLPRGETSPRRQQQASSEGQGQSQAPSSKPPATATTTTTTAATANTAATGAPTRRQSLMRPGTLKISSTRSNVSAQVPSKASASTPTFRPPSPRKPPMRSPQSSAPRPPSPKKTEMPPPPRPARSASLRQPANTGAPVSSAARGHARHRSQMVASSTKPIQSEAAHKPQPRAGFSTYQQHYSPKKPTTKPPTPTPGDTSSSAGLLIPTSWPDISALQTELLQLSLFHSSSLDRHAEWKSESESQLRKKYDAVASQYSSTLGDEKMRQQHMNVQALNQWAEFSREHNGPHGLSDQVQSLSQILQEVSDLLSGEMGGKYAHAVGVFENWFHQAEDIRYRSETSRVLDRIEFIDPLDQSWKEEVQGLQAKLDLCSRRLEALDLVGLGESEQLGRSAFSRVVRGLTESLQLMTQELRAMRTAELEMISSERETVSRMATQMTSFPLEKSSGRVGIWKT
ncbi:hypothetical protein N7478_004030 [Penicillium angulare]|uniref:uncharacterized protein n=1 Tax=Penicillium angulare TaxID=116970 RepID=UPI0025400086|nr:uncharacterized protein N7478_004030 [Penicillium angulare]KAJ5278658.1 hypothetical protein N7478_004030 [Penicillium angulare]